MVLAGNVGYYVFGRSHGTPSAQKREPGLATSWQQLVLQKVQTTGRGDVNNDGEFSGGDVTFLAS